MKVGVLFSGGKDSTFATYIAKKQGYEISCLISIFSKNKESYMFHTPSIDLTKEQAKVMHLPIIIQKTKGKKESELKDLESAIKQAIKKYKIKGIVTGAVESVYQSTRIQKICNKFKIECFNPLWQKNQIELLEELIKNKFEVIITGIAAEGFDESWLGRKIDNRTIEDLKNLKKKYKISLSGEGGEYESFVLWSPIFKKRIKLIKSKKIIESKNLGRLKIQEIT
jgi:ABC transporter with metal-binding/Fe-S-binding domain ATP-binding protein